MTNVVVIVVVIIFVVIIVSFTNAADIITHNSSNNYDFFCLAQFQLKQSIFQNYKATHLPNTK